MTIYVKDAATSEAVRKLAELRGVSLTEAVRVAVEQALRDERRKSLASKLDVISAKFEEQSKSGLQADKAFYDSLSEEP